MLMRFTSWRMFLFLLLLAVTVDLARFQPLPSQVLVDPADAKCNNKLIDRLLDSAFQASSVFQQSIAESTATGPEDSNGRIKLDNNNKNNVEYSKDAAQDSELPKPLSHSNSNPYDAIIQVRMRFAHLHHQHKFVQNHHRPRRPQQRSKVQSKYTIR